MTTNPGRIDSRDILGKPLSGTGLLADTEYGNSPAACEELLRGPLENFYRAAA